MQCFISPFLDYLRDNGYAWNTVEAYKSDLQLFHRFWGQTLAKDITQDHIVAYIASMAHLSKRTVDRRAFALDKFFAFLVQSGEISATPMVVFTKPVVPYIYPQTLTVKEVEKLLAIRTKTAFALRVRAMAALLCATGITLKEMYALDVDDFDAEKREIYLDDGRTLYIGFTATRMIDDYLAKRPRNVPLALFISQRGRRYISFKSFRAILSRHATQVGIKKHVTPRMIRNTVAVQRFNTGASLREVRDLLGYSNITAAMRFIPITDYELLRHSPPRERRG